MQISTIWEDIRIVYMNELAEMSLIMRYVYPIGGIKDEKITSAHNH